MLQVPPLEAVRVTDAVFGQQSELYKNASKHLKAESRLSTALVRHSVVLGRIQDNVSLLRRVRVRISVRVIVSVTVTVTVRVTLRNRVRIIIVIGANSIFNARCVTIVDIFMLTYFSLLYGRFVVLCLSPLLLTIRIR